MPKDEFDPEDPLELNGVAFFTEEDTTEAMAECFIEEFMRLGYNPRQMLALFRNPYYTGMNMVLQNKGEPFVRECIAATFAKWGRPFTWPVESENKAVNEHEAEKRQRVAAVEIPPGFGVRQPSAALYSDLIGAPGRPEALTESKATDL